MSYISECCVVRAPPAPKQRVEWLAARYSQKVSSRQERINNSGGKPPRQTGIPKELRR